MTFKGQYNFIMTQQASIKLYQYWSDIFLTFDSARRSKIERVLQNAEFWQPYLTQRYLCPVQPPSQIASRSVQLCGHNSPVTNQPTNDQPRNSICSNVNTYTLWVQCAHRRVPNKHRWQNKKIRNPLYQHYPHLVSMPVQVFLYNEPMI